MNYEEFAAGTFRLELSGRELCGLFAVLAEREAGLDGALTAVLNRVRLALYEELSIEDVEKLASTRPGKAAVR